MTEHHVLDILLRGMSFVSLILAGGMILFWGSSFVRTLKGKGTGRDGARAIWVSMAVAVVIYQVRWNAPGIPETGRLQLWLVAKAATVGALLGAIYHHGREDDNFDARKALLIHFAIIVLAILLAAIAG